MRNGPLLLTVLTVACGSPDATRAYFAIRRESFEHIVELAKACRPTGRVTADGLEFDGNPSDVRCENANQDIAGLRSELSNRGFREVSVSFVPDLDPARPNLSIVSFSDDKTDCHIGINYESEPDPNGGRHIYDAFADEYERYPLTGPPHHWFCESIGF